MIELLILLGLGAGAFHDYTRGFPVSKLLIKRAKKTRYMLESKEHRVQRALEESSARVGTVKDRIASLGATAKQCEESAQASKLMEEKLQEALIKQMRKKERITSPDTQQSVQEGLTIIDLATINGNIAVIAKAIAQQQTMQERYLETATNARNAMEALRPKLQLAKLKHNLFKSDIEVIKSNDAIADANTSCYQLTAEEYVEGDGATTKATIKGMLEQSAHRRHKSEFLLTMANQENSEGLLDAILEEETVQAVIKAAEGRLALPEASNGNGHGQKKLSAYTMPIDEVSPLDIDLFDLSTEYTDSQVIEVEAFD